MAVSMENIPSDIILNILSRVPAETVLECKLVCKDLGTLIRQSGTTFTNMHLNRQLDQLYGGDVNDNRTVANKMEVSLFFSCVLEKIFGTTLLFYGGRLGDKISINKKYSYKENLKKFVHPPMYDEQSNHFVGSCNGLLCIYIFHNLIMDPIYVCNPITREYVYLPELVVNKKEVEMFDMRRIEEGEVNMIARLVCGFGYVSSTNEYKVVRIHYPCSMNKGYVEVYTLGSGCGWRSKGTICIELNPHLGTTYVNEAIFFLADNGIMAFDLAKEEFRLVPFPPCMINRCEDDKFGLVELGGHLCFYLDRLRMEIWSLRKTNSFNSSDEKEIWCMDFDIDLEGGPVPRGWWYRPTTLTKYGEIILLCDFKSLYCYDPTTSTLEIISDEDEESTRYFNAVRAITHINTFVSLRAMGENSKTYKADGTWDDDVMIS